MPFWVIKLSLRYLFPKGRRGTFFTWGSMIGVTLGIALLVIVVSVMNGFDTNISEKLVQTQGAIKILSQDIILNYQDVMEVFGYFPYVKGVTPYVRGISLVQSDQRVAFPNCIGVDWDTVNDVLPLNKFLNSENKEGVFISVPLARDLGLKKNQTFDLYSPLVLEAIKNDEIILPQELNVDGTFKTGWAEIDQNTIIFPLKTLQETYGMTENAVHGFNVNTDQMYISLACKKLNYILPPNMHAYAWYELNSSFLQVLKMEKSMCIFILFFIVCIAAFSISSGLMFSTIRKQREISLLKTWGASNREITQIFCLQGFILGSIGTIFGFIISFFILKYRNWIINLLTGWFLPKDALWNFYEVEELPVAYCPLDYTVIAICTLVLIVLASFIPALAACNKPAVEGLRCE